MSEQNNMTEIKPVLMIVDDSNISRRTIISVINADNYEIIQAKNGRDAIEKLITMKINCMILDLLMPDIDGFGVLKFIKEKNIKIPVIVLSADLQNTTKELVMSLGAYDFLNKPPEKVSLNASLEKAIKKLD